MPYQIDDQQFYAIKACLERAYAELESAWSILYGNQISGISQGAASTAPNQVTKSYSATPPVVTKDHQAAVDAIDPDVQQSLAAEEESSQINLKHSVQQDVLVVNVSSNGYGDYYALVQCTNTMQQASVRIEEEEYKELYDITEDEEVTLTLTQDQIDDAEWEPIRGTSARAGGVCNCGGNVPKTNPYNDSKIASEISSEHSRVCKFWDYNTIIFDQNTGKPCYIELEKIDASAVYGFDMYNTARQAIESRLADPNDTLTNNDLDSMESDITMDEINVMASQLVGSPTNVVFTEDSAVFVTDEEEDDK